MRIMLYTGKGGVGKTSIAAATALRCADLGYRTIVLSTDAAHSLADSLDRPLGPEPVPVTERLWGQEIDIFHQIDEYWGKVKEYITGLMMWRGLDQVVADEMSVLPGMEELASLLVINQHATSGAYDVIVVDCAPTGETLRLLSFPEVARWWLEKIFPIERQMARLVRPMIRPFSDIPLPSDDMFGAVKELFTQLDLMHRMLSDWNLSTVRLVLNPEKMVIKETQRTYTYLHLFGYRTDAIICNRLIPDEVHDTYFQAWKDVQARYYGLVEESFAPVPILPAPLFDQEVVGLEMLRKMGERVYDGVNPTDILFTGRAHSIDRVDGSFVLNIPLPFVQKGDIVLSRFGDELVVHVGGHKRNLILPRALVGLETQEAKFEGDTLRIRFGGKQDGRRAGVEGKAR